MNEQNEEKQKTSILKKFFMIMGIVFTFFIFAVALLIVALIIIKPYGVDVTKVVPAVLEDNPTSSYDHPYLTTQQEIMLESVGIDPEDVPTEITPSQQQCAVEALGQERVNEIISGSTFTVTDVLKAKHCFE